MSPEPIGERFPRTVRLTRRSEFEAVLGRGFRVHGRCLVVQLLAQELPHSRLGLTVPRRVGSAVARNRVKRRLREIFRKRIRALLDGSGRGADVVVAARGESARATYGELESELLVAAHRWLRHARPRRGES
jgi:ribonuclease P protein component